MLKTTLPFIIGMILAIEGAICTSNQASVGARVLCGQAYAGAGHHSEGYHGPGGGRYLDIRERPARLPRLPLVVPVQPAGHRSVTGRSLISSQLVTY